MALFRSDLVEAAPPADISVPKKKNMMCLNESTLNPFEAIDEAFIMNMKHVQLNRYFSGVTKELQTELVNYIGGDITSKNVLWGNGADEMLFAIFLAVRENNESWALSLAPSYFDYSTYAGAAGLGIKFLDFKPDFSFDVDKYIELVNSDNCKLGILCNPNNPTGQLLDDEDIVKILKNTQKLILIDETYFEFSGKTYRDELKNYPNLVIVRSFSKSFSAAGLRFGYLMSRSENINQIRKVLTIFHSSLLIQTFVVTMLQNKNTFLAHTKKVMGLKSELYEEMAKIEGLKVYNSSTNFLTFSLGENSDKLFEYLKDSDIAIRDVGAHPVLKNHLRVSIGSKEQNEFFLTKVKEFVLKY